MEDKVTVVTPTWNSAQYIRETIASVQAQTYQNWEMVIVDDCSTDNTIEIVKKIENTFDLTPDGIINYLDLRQPIFTMTTNYGHFGKNELPWEKIIKF